MKKLTVLFAFALIVLSCSKDDTSSFPKVYEYDRTVAEAPIATIVASDGTLTSIDPIGGVQTVIDQFESGFADTVRNFFFFERFELLNEDEISIKISSSGQVMESM